MKRSLILAALLGAWWPGGALAADGVQRCMGRQYDVPAGVSVVCSSTWEFVGPCDGADLWDRWRVQGAGADGPFVRPFLDDRVVVIGYELIKTAGEPHAFFMIGSGIQADAFLWMPADATHARLMFPPGYGHPWPSKAESEAQRNSVNDLIDIHGSCAPTGAAPAPARPAPGLLDRILNVFRPQADQAPPAPRAAQPVRLYLTIYFSPWGQVPGAQPTGPSSR